MKLERIFWGSVNEEKLELFRITDEKNQFEVAFTDIGASIVHVKMPDRNGRQEDIHIGRGSPKEIFDNSDNGYLGSTVGRTASFLYFGQFEIDGKTYNTGKNMLGAHTQHGGFNGFNKKKWTCIAFEEFESYAELKFQYISPDGEEGFPGTLTTIITYKVTDEMEISWEMVSTTDKSTIVNLMNHGYWNLDGFGKLIDKQELCVKASKLYQIKMREIIKETLFHFLHLKRKHPKIPFEIEDCEKTRMDFTKPKKFLDIFKTAGNIDTNFILDCVDKGKEYPDLHFAGEINSPNTGRNLKMYTNQPIMIVYSGNDMNKVTAFGEKCQKHGAVCLEPCKFNCVIQDKEQKSEIILNPGETYIHRTTLKFSINK